MPCATHRLRLWMSLEIKTTTNDVNNDDDDGEDSEDDDDVFVNRVVDKLDGKWIFMSDHFSSGDKVAVIFIPLWHRERQLFALSCFVVSCSWAEVTNIFYLCPGMYLSRLDRAWFHSLHALISFFEGWFHNHGSVVLNLRTVEEYRLFMERKNLLIIRYPRDVVIVKHIGEFPRVKAICSTNVISDLSEYYE